MSLLSIEGLKVTYGSGRDALTAVDGVDLAVPAGQTLGLVGESGSGKSTIARAVVGLAPVTAGRIVLDGTDVTLAQGATAGVLRRRVQLVFQDPYSSLNPRMTVAETLGEAIAIHHRMSRAQRGRRIDELLHLVALDRDTAQRYPHQFSGGQRQRIAIARALAVEPDLIVADEVTSSLDVSVQGAVLNLLRDIQRQLGLSMLFISHNLMVVRYMSHQIAVMHLGKLVETAPRDDLFAAPRHPYTKTLLEALPTLGGPGDRRATVRGDVPDPHHPPSGCRFHTRCRFGPIVHPERAICAEQDPETVAASNPHRAACHFPLGVVQQMSRA